MADFLGLMKQATELKSKMEAMQAELDRIEVDGAAGGGLLTIKLSGKGEVQGRASRRFADQVGPEGNPRRTLSSPRTPTPAASSKRCWPNACRRSPAGCRCRRD